MAMIAALALPARAQQSDSVRADTVRRIAPVTVTEARRVPVTVGGASAIRTTLDSLSLSGAPVLEEALREVPFVHVRQNSRGESELTVRGSESRQVAVLLDGIPLMLGWDHRTDPSLVPLSGARSLTIVRGLASVLQGPNILGGVVEVDVAGGAAAGDDAGVRAAGSVDQVGARAVSFGGTSIRDPNLDLPGRLEARAGLGLRHVPGVVLGRGLTEPGTNGRRSNSDVESFDGFASVRSSSARGAWVGATVTGYRAERGVPPELHVAEPRRWRYPRQARTIGILTAGTGARATGWGRGAIRGSVAYNRGDYVIHDFASADYEQVAGRERGEEEVLVARVAGDHSLPRGARLDVALTGADVRFLETTDAARRYRQRLGSAAAELLSPVLGTSQISGGLVADFADTPRSGDKPALERLGAWGGRLGMTTVHASSGMRLHLSASHRARFPSLRELYSGSLGRFVPNPALRPERLLALETGVTSRRGALETQAVVFHHDLADAIVRAPTDDGRFRRENRQRIRSTGLEILSSWTRDALALETDLVFQHARVIDEATGSRRPEHQPWMQGDAEAMMPLFGGVRAMTAIRFAGTQYCIHPDDGREVALRGRARADAGVERTWTPRGRTWRAFRLSLAAENLLDAVVYDQCGLPQPGRTVRLGFSLR